ncbi:MAG: GAF domain-containing protein [Spirulina sp. SIO3F2]|nr:GAF domain-containing protein [Spirulina sp. SIO3F2]
MSNQDSGLTKAFKILSSLGKEFKRHRSEEEILGVIARKTYDLTKAPRIYVIAKHRLKQSLELVINLKDGNFQSLDNSESILDRIGRQKIQKVIKNQELIFLSQQDLINDQEIDFGCASWLGVPMSAVDRVIGALVIQHPSQPNAFSEEIGQVLDAITDLAANAIDYYRLHERTKLIANLEFELTEIKAKNEQNLLKQIYRKMQKLRRIDDIDILTLSIVLQDKYKRRLSVVIADGQIRNTKDINEQRRLLEKLKSDQIEKIISSSEPRLLCPGNSQAKRIEEMADTELAQWVGAPMRIHGRVIGAFVVEHPENAYVYNKNDAEFLDILSDQTANALERVRLSQRSRALASIEKNLLAQVTQGNFAKEKILEIVTHRAQEVCDVYNLCIFLYDAAEDTLQLELAYRKDKQIDLSNEAQRQEILSYAPEHILRQALEDPVLLKTKQEIRQKFGDRGQDRYPASWLGVPMRGSKGSIGVFAVYHMKYEHIYDQDDERILDELSDKVALALDNVRLRETEQKNFEQRIQDLESLGDIYEAVNQEPLENVLKLVLEAAVSYTQANYAEIWFCDFDKRVLQLKTAYKGLRQAQLKQAKFPLDEGLSSKAISTRNLVYYGNVKENPDYIEVSSDVYSELVIPLIFKNNVIGTMNLESKQVNAFSERQKKLASTLGELAAVAIEISTTNTQLKLYISLLEKLEKLTISEAPFDEELIVEYIHDRASELMDTGNMYIALYNPDNDLIEFKMVYLKKERQKLYEPRKLKTGRGKTEQIIKTHKPIRDTSEESRLWYKFEGINYTGENDGISSDLPWLGVPILLGQDGEERCLGVIATYNADKTHVYTEQDQAVLEKIGRWAAIALENAKIAKTVVEQENLLARSLVAQDLVHRLNSIAGAARVWLQFLKREVNTFEGVDVEDAKEYIANSFSELNNLIQQVKELDEIDPESLVLSKQVLLSLIKALKTLYHEEIALGKLTFENELDDDLHNIFGTPSLIANSLEAVLKNGIEAVLQKGKGNVNVLAKNIEINKSKAIKIVITDTGVGIDIERRSDIFALFSSTKGFDRGYGLWRAKMVFEKMGGHIHFESQPGIQTIFTIVLPSK